jgi:transposase
MNKGIRFTDEFKQDAVAQVVERGYPQNKTVLSLVML